MGERWSPLMAQLRALARASMTYDPQLYAIGDSDDVKVWHVSFLFHGDEARRCGTGQVDLVLRFENAVGAPNVRIVRPRMDGPNLFLGVLCASELSAAAWRLSAVESVLLTVRQHIAQHCRLERDGEYADVEQDDMTAHIASHHPEWGMNLGDGRRHAEACVKRAEALEAAGDFPGAIKALDEALAVAPTALIHNQKGNVLLKIGDYGGAREQFQAALDRADHNTFRHNLAYALLYLGRLTEALTVANTVQPAPYTSALFLPLAATLKRVAMREIHSTPESALTVLRQSLHFNPLDESVYNEVGVACFILKRYEEAAAAFSQALDMASDMYGESCALLIMNRGRALYHLGAHVGSVFDARQYLSLHPESAYDRALRDKCFQAIGVPHLANHCGPEAPPNAHFDTDWVTVLHGNRDTRWEAVQSLESKLLLSVGGKNAVENRVRTPPPQPRPPPPPVPIDAEFDALPGPVAAQSEAAAGGVNVEQGDGGTRVPSREPSSNRSASSMFYTESDEVIL